MWVLAEWLKKTGELISESCLQVLLLWVLHYGLTKCRQDYLPVFCFTVTRIVEDDELTCVKSPVCELSLQISLTGKF